MARIPKTSPRFRTKEQICQDLQIVIGNSELSYAAKFAVAADVTWVWSEYYGKHKGCPYWSEKALAGDQMPKSLVHEHAVPKRILIRWLLELDMPSLQELEALLSKYCIGVVVTKEEDKALNAAGLRSKMPEDWDNQNPWARYEAVGIVPVKLSKHATAALK